MAPYRQASSSSSSITRNRFSSHAPGLLNQKLGFRPAIWVSLCPPGGSDATKAFDPLLWSKETSLCLGLFKPGVERHVPLAGFVHHLTPVDIAIHAQNHLKWLTVSPQAEAWRDSDPCSQSHSQRFQFCSALNDMPHRQQRLSFGGNAQARPRFSPLLPACLYPDEICSPVCNHDHLLNRAVVGCGRVGDLEKGRCSSASNSVPHSGARESLGRRNAGFFVPSSPSHKQLVPRNHSQPALRGGGRRAICHLTMDTGSGFPWRRWLCSHRSLAPRPLAEASPS